MLSGNGTRASAFCRNLLGPLKDLTRRAAISVLAASVALGTMPVQAQTAGPSPAAPAPTAPATNPAPSQAAPGVPPMGPQIRPPRPLGQPVLPSPAQPSTAQPASKSSPAEMATGQRAPGTPVPSGGGGVTPDPVKTEPPAMAAQKPEAKPDTAAAESDKAKTDKADAEKTDAEKAETAKTEGPTVLAGEPPTAITVGDFDKKAPEDPEAPFNGSFTQRIPLEVPGFRGLEPKLNLVYDSSQGLRAGGMNAGLLGVGWDLGGLSDIVRVSRVNGAPRFDAADTWLLDGAELVPCGQVSSSPSCSYGGTHTTRVESYKHILFNESENSWTVTARDGTRYIYRSTQYFRGGDDSGNEGHYRYMLWRILDWRNDNNIVHYYYSCPSFSVCYPVQIVYNGSTVDFYWQERGAEQKTRLANGIDLSWVSDQLKSIFVTTGTGIVRAYAFTYEASPATGLSRLIGVQQYGKDAVWDNGNVAGGTALPPIGISYTNTGASFAAPSTLPFLPVFQTFPSQKTSIGDFNGDGRSDVIAGPNNDNCQNPGGTCLPDPAFIYLSNGAGYTLWQSLNLSLGPLDLYVNVENDRWVVGDFDGDGRSDFVRIYQVTGYPSNPNDPSAPLLSGPGAILYRSTSSGLVASTVFGPILGGAAA
ncbi:exported hypothetical protein [Hyphomicrobiales bacterium]|nr:exported hypothetical protein [Hyphomicrobiales bacterium]CAH1692261.1 exported hypothetical protein [Hyphomicrobiales bacterium]